MELLRPFGFDTSWILATRVAADLRGAFSYPFSPASIASSHPFLLDSVLPAFSRNRRFTLPMVEWTTAFIYQKEGLEKPLWTAGELARLEPDFLAEKLVSLYPEKKYPAIVIGSPNGGTASLASHLGAPYLPTQLTINVLSPLARADLPEAVRRWEPLMESVKRSEWFRLIANFDPFCDLESGLNSCMLRFVFTGIPPAYERFINGHLADGGALIHLSSIHDGRMVRLKGENYVQVWEAAAGEFQDCDSEMASTKEFVRTIEARGNARGRFLSITSEHPVSLGSLLFRATHPQGATEAIVSSYCAVPPLQDRVSCGKYWFPFPDRALFSHPMEAPENALDFLAGEGIEDVLLIRDAVMGRRVVRLDEWEARLRDRFARHRIVGDVSPSNAKGLSAFARLGRDLRGVFEENRRKPKKTRLDMQRLEDSVKKVPGVKVSRRV